MKSHHNFDSQKKTVCVCVGTSWQKPLAEWSSSTSWQSRKGTRQETHFAPVVIWMTQMVWESKVDLKKTFYNLLPFDISSPDHPPPPTFPCPVHPSSSSLSSSSSSLPLSFPVTVASRAPLAFMLCRLNFSTTSLFMTLLFAVWKRFQGHGWIQRAAGAVCYCAVDIKCEFYFFCDALTTLVMLLYSVQMALK